MTLGERIRRLRKQHGWTQVEFAEKVGVHDRHVSRWETGVFSPRGKTLEQIAAAFGLSVEEFYGHPSTPPLPDDALLRQFQEIQDLSEEERGAISIVLNAFLTKKRMERVLQPAAKSGG